MSAAYARLRGWSSALARSSGACLFLVATGRASASQDLTAEEYEKVFAFLYNLSKTASFDIKTTEAQHYRRYVAQSRKADGEGGGAARRTAPEIIHRRAGINDGKGFVFVSHTGEIYPSGFLPLTAGNVRRDSLTAVYRESPLFRTLRNTDNLEGKCGECEYRNLCGGSRSRSYALTGMRWLKSRGASINRSRWAALLPAIGARNRQGSYLSGTTHPSSS